MLLTDGSPNGTEDLRVYESAILGLANLETIDLGVKLELATEEIAEDVLDFLLDHAGTNLQVFSPFQIGTPAARRRMIGVSDVVVTRQLKRWHAVHTLEIVYRDAFNNQLNDRYQPKFLEYRELTRNAREHTFHFGVGLALTPIPQAQVPVFSAVAGLDSRDHLLCAGVVGGSVGAGGSAERDDGLWSAGWKPAGGADDRSSGGSDGFQRLSRADAGWAGIAKSDAGSGGAEFHAAGDGAGGGCSAGRRASRRHLYQRRLDAAAGLKRWPRQEASRRGRWWSS